METKVYYLHIPSGYSRRGTIAAIIKNDELYIGVSLCSPKDNFSKSIGRSISAGRADKKAYKIVKIDKLKIIPGRIGKYIGSELAIVLNQIVEENNICVFSLR